MSGRWFPPLVDVDRREIHITPGWIAAATIGGVLIERTIVFLLAVGP